jgi:hypothetical protein
VQRESGAKLIIAEFGVGIFRGAAAESENMNTRKACIHFGEILALALGDVGDGAQHDDRGQRKLDEQAGRPKKPPAAPVTMVSSGGWSCADPSSARSDRAR